MYVSDVYTTVPVELRQARIVKETSNHCKFIHASNLIRVEQERSAGELFERSRSGARINRAVISVALNYICMYVCMYAVKLQEFNCGFYACAHRHHNSCIGRSHCAAAGPE